MTKPEQRKSNAGRKPYDTILKFKIVVLQSLHNLSDEQTKYLIRDRISFMRFLDLELEDPVPDATTIWLFREALAQAGLIDRLFERFGQHLEAAGYLRAVARSLTPRLCRCPKAAQHEGGERGDQSRQDPGGMEEAARQECPEGQGRALDEEERREFLRLQEPPRRGQGAQADPANEMDGRAARIGSHSALLTVCCLSRWMSWRSGAAWLTVMPDVRRAPHNEASP
jgi:IS5 family transposase